MGEKGLFKRKTDKENLTAYPLHSSTENSFQEYQSKFFANTL